MRIIAKTAVIMLAAGSLGACAEYRNNETLRSAGKAAIAMGPTLGKKATSAPGGARWLK